MQKYNENGRHVCIVKQEDGAGLHTDKTYLARMKELFDERDWLLFNQPSQSPITNVHDACIFPMMSKSASKSQALVFGSQLSKGEELNKTVMNVYNNKDHLPAIARAFAGHNQIVCAIIENNGDNNYLSKRKGLSFGIRRCYITDEEGEGVIPVPVTMAESETAQTQIISERQSRGLRYDEPKISDLSKAKLTDRMKEFLLEHMDPDLMDDELMGYYYEAMYPDDFNEDAAEETVENEAAEADI